MNSSVEIENIFLKNFDGSRQEIITHLITKFNLYESLDTHTMSAEFYIADGLELIDKFPIVGEEQIVFTMKTPERDEISYEFQVESVINQHLNVMGTMKYYVLRCATKDYLMNAFKLFTKRYYGMEYKEAVSETIATQLGSGKPLYVEPTKGFFDYMVNRVRPFQAIDLLCEQACSAKYASSYFIFYEDRNQYNFRTIEDLIAERKKTIGDKEFYLNNAEHDDLTNITWRNILQYETFNVGDGIEKVKRGGMYSEVREFDVLHGDYFTKYDYKNTSDHMMFEKVDEAYDFNSDSYQKFVTEKPASRLMVATDQARVQPFNAHIETIPWIQAYKEKIFQYGVKIRVYGDTSIVVGDVIKINIHKITGADEQKEDQQIFSGNFLIKDLKHRIDREEDGGWAHYMILDCRKMNLKGAV